jgi:hypothetical protein
MKLLEQKRNDAGFLVLFASRPPYPALSASEYIIKVPPRRSCHEPPVAGIYLIAEKGYLKP